MLHVRFTMEERKVAHAAELFEVLREPALYEFLEEAPPRSVEELAQKLARSESRLSPDGKEHWLNWVVRVESGTMAGYVQATVEQNKEVNLAYVLSRRYHGHGIATSAVQRVIEIVETQYEATTFFVVAESANVASVKLAQRLGFAFASPAVTAMRRGTQTDVVLFKQAACSVA
jgi:[ribosomal protein S5]-alanine N-acetyltransferase